MATFEVTKENFEEKVLKSDKPVLIDFWADWCGPCKMIGPIIEEISDEMDNVLFGKLNTDENQELAVEFGVMSIPTLILFKDGEAKAQTVGVQPKEDLEEFINGNI